MNAILILAGSFSSCHSSELIWKEVCDKYNIKLEIYDLSNETAQRYSTELNLKSFPAFIINNKVLAVGHPNKQTAEKIMSDLKRNQH